MQHETTILQLKETAEQVQDKTHESGQLQNVTLT
jgi:hypothetical protein